jgi:predicted SAM-dependent methyltransferase
MINNDINRFNEEGYVLLSSLILNEDLENLKKYFDKNFQQYEEGLLNNNQIRRDHPYYINSLKYDPNAKRKLSFYIEDKKIRVDGMPLKHRIFRGQGSPNLNETPNILYGKRLSKNLVDIDDEILKHIFFDDLLKGCKKILNHQELLFLEGSANRIFPKYSGESSIMHIDTYGFTFGDNEKKSEQDYFLNMLLYVNGSGEGRSPTRIIPKSHKLYNEINERIAVSTKKDSNYNCIHQRELYYEILGDYRNEMIEIEANPGDVLIINSNLIHGISENKNELNFRDAVILNISRKNQYFGKGRSKEQLEKLNKKLNPFQLQAINERFLPSIKRSIKYKGKKLIKKIFLINNHKLKKTLRFETKRNNQIKLSDKIYLNLGSGPNFYDKKTVSLDYIDNPEKIGLRTDIPVDINFDLSSFKNLPFEDNRFEGVYTSHCLEHLTDKNVNFVISEVFRVLKTGGVFRITVPDISKYFDAYDRKDLHFFNWIRNKMPYLYDSWLRFITREFAGNVVDDFSDIELEQKYKTLGRKNYCDYFGKLSNENTDKNRNIPDIHKSYWDIEKMGNAFKNVGFKNTYERKQFDGSIDYFVNKSNTMFNSTRPNISLYYEGIK